MLDRMEVTILNFL